MNDVEKLLLLLDGSGSGSKPAKIRQQRPRATWIPQAPSKVFVDIGRLFSEEDR